jgi:WD40 repeat protein
LRRTAALTSPSSQAPGQQVPPPTHHAPSSSATSHQNAASTSRPIREGNPLVGRGLAATQRSFGNPTSNHTMSSSNHLTSSSNHPTSSPSNPVSYSATARPYLPPSLFLEHSLHLTSCSLSPDHTFLTVTTMASGAPFKALHHKQSIDIYDLRTMSLHATAQGLPQSSFVIRASLLHGFPGARSSGATGASGASGGFMLQSPSSLPDPPTSAPFMLLASGSEDSLVHLWDLSQGPNNGPFASSSSSKEQPGQAGGPPSSHSRPSVHSVPTSRRRIAPRIPSASSAGANGAIPTTGPQPFRLPSSHSSVVNDVDWHPKIPLLLASASDDHSVRLWCPH